MKENKMAMSIEEAAAYTGIGRNTMRKLVEWKKLPVLFVGRKILIRKDALERFIAANEGKNLRERAEVVPIETGRGTTIVTFPGKEAYYGEQKDA